MNITLNIQAENPQELQEAISGLAASIGGASIVTPEPDKPKRNTKPKPEPEKRAEPDPETESHDNEDDSESVTVEQLRAKASKVAKAGNQPAVKALLDKFGSKSVSAIPEDRRADFMNALEAI